MKIYINDHSSIRIKDKLTVWFDPFLLKNEPHDADVIFITHSHHDHFSPEDIAKAANEGTLFVLPACMRGAEKVPENALFVEPGDGLDVLGLRVSVLPAYNIGKRFHPRENGFAAYVVSFKGGTVFVAGDADLTPEAEAIKCDIALLPCGGKYTMNESEAAALANRIKPRVAIPTHYGAVAGDKDSGGRFCALLGDGIRGLDIMGTETEI